MTKAKYTASAIMAAVTLTVAAFIAGRLSTTLWPIGGDSVVIACAEYMKARAAFLRGEREFENAHSKYQYPVHAAVFRSFEPPSSYLARVSTNEAHAAYVQRRDDCARHLAAQR